MSIRIVEVGPRDGLQNEATPVPTDLKLRFIAALAEAGIQDIEATSFVSPKWVPQLADAAELWPQLPAGPQYSALVPNMKGLERALGLGVRRIALFTAASESFTRRNINMSVDESLEVFAEVCAAAKGCWVRGYVSTAFHCPYEGRISPEQTLRVVDRLLELGVNEVSIGDTVGRAAPPEVRALASGLSDSRIAWHFHDTFGTACANVQAALDLGFGVFDSSAAGLGGCPYAPGAGGNLATEDLVYLLERQGIRTGVDLPLLCQASADILALLERPPTAKAQVATLAAR